MLDFPVLIFADLLLPADWPMLLAVVVFVVLQVLDVVSTVRALAAGGQEANPFVRQLQRLLGPLGGLLAAKLLAFALLAWSVHAHGWGSLWAWLVLDAVYLAVVVHNMRVARTGVAA